MKFFLKISKKFSDYDIVLCGKNIRHSKEYVNARILRSGLKYEDFKKELNDRFNFHNGIKQWPNKVSAWRRKNQHHNIKTEIRRKAASDAVIFAEKSIDMYTGSFSVRIDFINTMNQIMFGMSEIATSETEYFDWIRVRRTGLKNKTESSFFKLTQIQDLFNSKKNFRMGVKYKIEPLFKMVTEKEEDVLEYFSKYLKENEELKLEL